MPSYTSLLERLVKSDRRKAWKALKTKHAAALSARRLKFDAGFGPALDTYAKPVAAVNKLFVDEKLSQPALQKVQAAAGPLQQTAQGYLDGVKGLGGPAEKELSAFLQAVIEDCQGWDEVIDLFEDVAAPMPRAALTATKGLYETLERALGQLENLGKSLPAASNDLKAGRTPPPRAKVKPVGLSAAEWSHVKSVPDATWNKLFEDKVDALLAIVEQLTDLRGPAELDLAPLLTAVNRFDANANYEGFKQRAQKVALSRLPPLARACRAFLDAQADDEVKTELGFDNGLPFLQVSRVKSAVRQLGEVSVDLYAAIKKLP